MRFDRTLVQIRERSFPELLDLAVVVIRKRFRVIAPTALLGIVPFILFNAWVASWPDRGTLLIFLIPLEAPWATAPLTLVLASLMFGETITPRKIGSRLISALPALIFYQLIIRAILLIVFILIPLIPTRMGFTNEVLLLERDRWYKALKRVGTLSESRGGDLFGQFLAMMCATTAFVACSYIGSGTIINSLFEADLTWEPASFADFVGLRVQIPLWIAIAFSAVVRFFSYIDQRIRIEGWEVELRLKLVAQSMEEAKQW